MTRRRAVLLAAVTYTAGVVLALLASARGLVSLQTLGDIALLMWAAPAIAAPLIYLTVPDWRRSPLGWHIMMFMVAYGLLGLLGIVSVGVRHGLLGEAAQGSPLVPGLRVAVFVLGVIPVTWWRVGVVLHGKRYGRRIGESATLPSEAAPDQDGPARP